MLKIRRSRDRLIFNMESPYLGKTVFRLRRGPAYLKLGIDWWKDAMTARQNALLVTIEGDVLPAAITATTILVTYPLIEVAANHLKNGYR